MTDTEMLEMIDRNKRGLDSGKFEQAELSEIVQIIAKAKNAQM